MKSELIDCIYSDLIRYEGEFKKKTYLKKYFKNCLWNPGFRYMSLFRKVRYYKEKNYVIYMVYRFRLRNCSRKYGFQIPYSVDIGKGFYIGHWGRIIINPKVTIGNNINIASGVVIGQTNRGELKGVPKIGNKVWIGANVVIVGNIVIGDNVLIAPNTYVNRDIPNNSICMGNPMQVMYNEFATKSYINNIV